MTDINITLTEATARFYADHAGILTQEAAEVAEACKAALPAKPEWEVGQIARVHYQHAGPDPSVTFAEWRDGEWKFANGFGSYELRNCVTRVEPIAVVPKGHIAIERPAFFSPSWHRKRAIALRELDWATSAFIHEQIADALETEEER